MLARLRLDGMTDDVLLLDGESLDWLLLEPLTVDEGVAARLPGRFNSARLPTRVDAARLPGRFNSARLPQ